MKRVAVSSAVVNCAVVAGLAVAGLGLGGGLACSRGAPMTRARVSLVGDRAGAGGPASDVVAAAVAVEKAIEQSGPRKAGAVHTAVCGGSEQRGVAVVVVDGLDGPALDALLPKAGLSPAITATTETLDDEVAVFAVRSDDPFAARAFVDRALRPALSAVKDVTRVDVVGGKRQRQVLIDLRKMLANDLTLPELLSVAGGGASLEATVAKTSSPSGAPPAAGLPGGGPMLVKAPLPPQQPGEVRVMLSDVADIGLFPVGEPLRRDGAIEVRVAGPRSARDAVMAAVARIQGPAGLEVAPLDDDSVEGVDVVVAAPPAGVDELRRDLLGIPGVRLADDAPGMRIAIDPAAIAKLGVSADAVQAVVDVALSPGGRVLLRNTENITVRLKGEVPPELLMQLVVARTAAGPVRLIDVAQLLPTPPRGDRLDGQPAQRVRVLFDVGVRKIALAAVEQAVARRSLKAIVERRDIVRGICP